jgi:ferredoxin
MSESTWYYARDNEPVGPVSSARLRALAAAGILSPRDLVLKVGSQQWVVAANVKGLFSPPPAPPATPASIPASAPVKARDLFASRHEVLSQAQVVPEATRCVQCGICSYNCPMEIDVRAHARQGLPIFDSHCLTCSECVKRCPRGVLRFERLSLLGGK